MHAQTRQVALRARAGVLLMLVSVVAACSPSASPPPAAPASSTNSSTTAGAAPSPAAPTGGGGTTQVVKYAEFVSLGSSPSFVAQALGYFAEEGLDAQPIPTQSGSDLIAPMSRGDIDVGTASPTAGLFNAAARGIPIKIVSDWTDVGVDLTQRRMGERLDLGNGHVAAHFRGGWGRPVARWAPDIGAALKPEVDARWRDLVARFGPERAARMADTDRNLYIFPNLVIQDHFAVTIRTFQPLGPDRLEVTSWALAPVDESPEMRSVRLANYLTFWGPAGFATPDDIEALETAQRGFADQEVVWCDVSKGALREGSQDVEGTSADELQLRAFWRRWRSCLEAAGA